MRIPIDRHSKTPLYQQVQDYLRAHILSGQLAPDTRLPATRKLAEELGLSRITIQNAYANLESEALIANVEGSGAYVLPPLHTYATQSEQSRPEWPLWQQALNDTAGNEPSALLATTDNPQTISFTGVGDPRHFPIKEFQQSLRAVLHDEGTAALEYC